MPHRSCGFFAYFCHKMACAKLPKAWRAFTLSVCILLCGGCAKTIDVVHESEFQRMALRIPSLLEAHAVIDEQKGYTANTLFFLSGDTGQLLFERLSPAFRFQVDPTLIPPTFKASYKEGHALSIEPYGFTMQHGEETVMIRLLARVHWNHSEDLKSIVLCRVLQADKSVFRDYYLLIDSLDANPMIPQVMAVYDARQGQTAIVMHPENAMENPYLIELDPGQQVVVPPPTTTAVPPDGPSQETLAQ